MKTLATLILACSAVWTLVVGSADAQTSTNQSENAKGPYEPTWESLKKHQRPEWFKDAKFGIYTHWGPVTVGTEDGPGGVQWYGRNMYVEKSPTFEYHRKRFGDQHKIGYKDIIPLFKAEKFDAEAWAELFAAAGAKFAGPVAIHHDNFAMWGSALTEWDSMDKGPKRDITGELEKAIRKHGMKFIATFHHGFTWRYYEPAYKFDAADGKHAGLYCQPHEPDAPPTKEYLDLWLAKVNEVVKKYEPDLIWFDFGLKRVVTTEYQKRMFADYYNWAAKHGCEVGVAHKHRDIQQHTGILDFERGREDNLTPYPWLTDTSVGPWFHQESVKFRSVDDFVDVLVDIVSKNGCMLLNVGPAADGSIPKDAQKVLRGIGEWLQVNGPAIYNTRPWKVFGEGPTRNTGGGFSEKKDKPYTSQDVRFIRSKDAKTLYIIVLGWPNQDLTIRSMRVAGRGQLELLGYQGEIEHRINDFSQLVITPPQDKVGVHAFAFRLTGFDVDLHPEARPLRLAFITCVVDAKFFEPVKKGMNDAADMMGVLCDFVGTEGVDVQAQVQMVRQATADGYDGIAVNIIDPQAFDEVIQEAIEQKVPVVAFNVDDHATPNARLGSVNQRLYDAGHSLAEHLLPHIPDNSHILMTMHDKGVSALEDRLRGQQDVLKKKGVKWTVIVTGNDSVKGADVITRTLKANPEIRIVLGTGQSDTEAAGRAIETYFAGRGYWSAGFDLSPETLRLIREGHILCTVDQQPYIQGFYPVVQLTHYLRYGIVPSDIDAGAAIIDRSNVNQVIELSQRQYR